MPYDISKQELYDQLADLPVAERWKRIQQELSTQWKWLESLDPLTRVQQEGFLWIQDFRNAFDLLLPEKTVPISMVQSELQARIRLGIPFSLEQYKMNFPSLESDLYSETFETIANSEVEYATVLPSSSDSSPVNQGIENPVLRDTIAPGRAFGHYVVDQILGQGGMGTVYRARHTKLNRWVAIKTIPSDLVRNQELLSRFDREMTSIGRLNHPNVVGAMDAGMIDGIPYLVMELLEGTDLRRHIIENGPAAPRVACELLRQVAMGLACAHQNGLVHRDIKPANLFLTDSGVVKLLDLGLAKLTNSGDMESSEQQLSRGFGQLGTLDYMSPEQWDGVESIDGRADLYALGCTLFFLIHGRAPFDYSSSRSLGKVMKAHLFEEPPRLLSDSVRLNGLEEIYSQLMAKEREQRFANAEELIAALDRVLLGAPFDTTREGIQPNRPLSQGMIQTKKANLLQRLPGVNLLLTFPFRKRGSWLVWILLAGTVMLGTLCVSLALFSDFVTPSRLTSIEPTRHVERLIAEFRDSASGQIVDKSGLIKALQLELTGLSGLEQELEELQQLDSDFQQARQAVFDFSLPDKVKIRSLSSLERIKGLPLSDEERTFVEAIQKGASVPLCFYPEKTYVQVRQLAESIDARRKLLQFHLDKLK